MVNIAPNAPESGVLSGIPLFRNLTPEQLSRLAAHLNRTNFSAGAHVITAEEPGETVYIVLEGSVKVHVEEPYGTQIILAILGPGR